jgi:ABC-type glycerol-3-phosphate transport system substrate-binding protein
MKQMLATYVKDHPTVTIEFQTLGWDDVFAKLDTLLVAGTPPELVVMHATEIPQYGSRAALQPVDDWFARKLLPKDDFSQAVLDKATWAGKILAVPLDIHDYNSYASANMIKTVGLDPSNPPVGQDFIDAAQKLSHNQKDPSRAAFATADFGDFGSKALLRQWRSVDGNGSKATTAGGPHTANARYHRRCGATTRIAKDAGRERRARCAGSRPTGYGAWTVGSWGGCRHAGSVTGRCGAVLAAGAWPSSGRTRAGAGCGT